MPGIFVRKNLSEIVNNADLTPEQRVDEIMSLYGRSIDDGFMTKKAAEAAQAAAIEAAKTEWEKNVPKVNVLETPEYKELQGQFDSYKDKTAARTSDDYKDVKPKFFDRVYDMIDRGEGAKPIPEQIAGIKKDFEEFFNPIEEPPKPTFGGSTSGAMPKGDESAVSAMAKVWGLPGTK